MENIPRPDMLMTTRQVAHLLHVHPNTVRKWVTDGILVAYRLGPRGDRRFTHDEIRRFLHADRAESAQALPPEPGNHP